MNQKRFKKLIQSFLINLSGNDLISMIHDVLTKEDREILFLKYIKALKGTSIFANKTKDKKRHHFIRPLRKAKMSYLEVRRIGFNCSKNLWQSCLRRGERNLGGRKPLPGNLITEIDMHMKEIAEISANRTFVQRQYNRRIPTIIYKKRTIFKSDQIVRYRHLKMHIYNIKTKTLI